MLEIVALGNKIVKLDRANYWGCLGDSAGKESACNAADLGSVPELERSLWKGDGYRLQCSDLENPMNCIVHVVAKSWTWLRDIHFHWGCQMKFYILENKLRVIKVERGGRMNCESGIVIYRLLCMKKITSESLLYRTGNCTQ